MLFDIRALGGNQRISLQVDAADASDAADQARLQGLTVLDVRPAAGWGRLPWTRRLHFPL